MITWLAKLWGAGNNPSQSGPSFFLLTDVATDAVLALSQHLGSIAFLHQSTPDTSFILWAGRPNYPHTFPLASVAPEDYPLWSYTRDRMIVPTRPDVLTDRIKSLSRLAVAKENAVSGMVRDINAARLRRSGGLLFQEQIYLKKQLEAERFMASDYDESTMLDYPYILQYADFAGITPRAAADEIVLKAKMNDDEMAKTEFLRLKFFQKLKNVTTPDEIPGVLEEFRRELYINAVI